MDWRSKWIHLFQAFSLWLRTVCKAKACKVLIRSCHIPTSIYPTSHYATMSLPLVISLQVLQPPALWISLVPRPHCLTRRNDLVNRVKFLGLVHTFATMSPSNLLKKGTHIWVDFIVVREVLHNITDLAISLVITTFGNKPKEVKLCSPDYFSPGGAHRLGTRLPLDGQY